MSKNTTVIGTTPVYETEEQKLEAFRARKNEASKRMLARKAEALEKLIALAEKHGNAEEKLAAKYLSGGRQMGTQKSVVVEYLQDHGSADEMEIFKQFKLGRTEMKALMKKYPEVQFTGEGYIIIEE
jgi:hypothetical protein